MKIFDIRIDDKNYKFVDSINLNGKNYIAYEDDENTYISEYEIEDDEVKFTPVSDKELNTVKEAMGL
ncbi:MAG: DUF1292 domain-containing protein [Bacilli bacterium]|nr:DUF1292 domain-containing protein [Bacilli bacterium]